MQKIEIKDLKNLSWKSWFMIITMLLAAGIGGGTVNVMMNVQGEVAMIKDSLQHTINSTFYGLQKPVSYIVSVVTSGATTYYCMQNGTTGKLDFWSTNASAVINFALGNLTTGRTWQEKVLFKGDINITNSLLVSSWTDVEIQGRIMLADGANCEIIKQKSTTDIMFISIHGGMLHGNKLGQSAEKDGISFTYTGGTYQNEGLKIYDITVVGVRGWAISLDHMMVPSIDHALLLDVSGPNYMDTRSWGCLKLMATYDGVFTDCVMSSDSTYGGLYCGAGTVSNRFTGCYFGGGAYGVWLDNDEGNEFFSNCLSNDNAEGGYIIHDSQFNTIVGGRCGDNSWGGKGVYSDIRLIDSMNCSITSVTFYCEVPSKDGQSHNAIEETGTSNYNVAGFNVAYGHNDTIAYDKNGANSDFSNNIGTTNSTALPLHVDGNKIKDANGNIVYLRGANYFLYTDTHGKAWLTSSGSSTGASSDWDTQVVPAIKENFDKMASFNFNYFRIHTCAQDWLQVSDFIPHMQQIASLAAERGIYVSIDIYSVADIYPDTLKMPYPPYTSNASTAIIPSEQAFIDLWATIANAMKNSPNVILGELFNEPKGNYATDPNWFSNDYVNFTGVCQSVITRIRQITDLPIMIMWGFTVGVDLSGPYTWEPSVLMNTFADDPQIQGTNIIYSFHWYQDNPQYNQTPVNDMNSFTQFMSYGKFDDVAARKPLLCTELGGLRNNSFALTWMTNAIDILYARGTGFAGWVWSAPLMTNHGDEIIAGANFALTDKGFLFTQKTLQMD